MTTVSESIGAPTAIGSDLQAGVEQISLNQRITFTRYKRLVLPIDGFVFWVNTDLLNPSASALFNRALLGAVKFDQPPRFHRVATTLEAQGSLHYATETRQDEQNSYAVNTVVFTSQQEVAELNRIAPDELWLAEIDGVRFSFSRRNSFYRQAALWHYQGQAVYSDMSPQIVDTLAGFNARQIVSNSLPAWLAIANYSSIQGFGPIQFPLFPSYLVPDNLKPPYGIVHVDPEGTRAMASTQTIGPTLSLYQLASDRVRVTLIGLRNDAAMDFVSVVNQYSLDSDAIGIMNMPILRDEKRTQPELLTISMKKVVEFEVSYYQARMNEVARQLIEECLPNFFVEGLPIPPRTPAALKFDFVGNSQYVPLALRSF